jgi:alpha-L-fucosidase
MLLFSGALLALPYLISGQEYERGYAEKVENAVDAVAKANAHGPYQPSWESIKQYKIPAWYQDAKFGIFIHWGVYSVPAFDSEWYPRNMYMEGTDAFKHHVETYGPQSQFGYKDFIPLFKAEKFDPEAWAELFRKAGAKYVIPVAEHHSRCTTVALRIGARRRWVQSAMSSASLRQPFAKKVFILVHHHIALSIGFSTKVAETFIPTLTTRGISACIVRRCPDECRGRIGTINLTRPIWTTG